LYSFSFIEAIVKFVSIHGVSQVFAIHALDSFRLVLVASACKSKISNRAPVLNRQTTQVLAPAALMIVLVEVIQQQDETDQNCNKRSDP